MNNQGRPYEPLTSQNAALVFVDHQVGLMTEGPGHFHGRTQTQRGGSGQSCKSTETPNRRYHDCA
jgi:hypothetical protein